MARQRPFWTVPGWLRALGVALVLPALLVFSALRSLAALVILFTVYGICWLFILAPSRIMSSMAQRRSRQPS